jgi:tetratricopeptide (TPR) repeat protein
MRLSPRNASINNTTTDENHIAINESDPVYWYNKDEVLLNSGRYNESIDAYNEAIELNHSFEGSMET